MKTLKALGWFIAGAFTSVYMFAKKCDENTTYPREGAVVFEDDNIKVTRVTVKPGHKVDLATIVYKKKED